MFCFFFQAEDGIRDRNVTGFRRVLFRSHLGARQALHHVVVDLEGAALAGAKMALDMDLNQEGDVAVARSEERRVGKECRAQWSRYHGNKKILSGWTQIA